MEHGEEQLEVSGSGEGRAQRAVPAGLKSLILPPGPQALHIGKEWSGKTCF